MKASGNDRCRCCVRCALSVFFWGAGGRPSVLPFWPPRQKSGIRKAGRIYRRVAMRLYRVAPLGIGSRLGSGPVLGYSDCYPKQSQGHAPAGAQTRAAGRPARTAVPRWYARANVIYTHIHAPAPHPVLLRVLLGGSSFIHARTGDYSTWLTRFTTVNVHMIFPWR